MIRLVIGLVALFLLWRVWRVLTLEGDASTRERRRKIGLYALGAVLMALGLWLAATGKFHVAWVGLLGLFAWLRRGMLFYNMFRNFGGGGSRAFGQGGAKRGAGAEDGFRQHFDSFFRQAQDKAQSKRRAQHSAGMTQKQAEQLLGVSERASKQEITRAFRSKMRAAHPDVGGDEKLASRLNAARDLLLRG